jgi:hypothetical protein
VFQFIGFAAGQTALASEVKIQHIAVDHRFTPVGDLLVTLGAVATLLCLVKLFHGNTLLIFLIIFSIFSDTLPSPPQQCGGYVSGKIFLKITFQKMGGQLSV